MIPARKQKVFNFLLRRWMTRVVQRRFHNVYLAGGRHLNELGSQPVIGCVNHTNWWDGFILYLLSHRCLPHEVYLAMEERNLRRYRFMTWMGAFGVDLDGPRGAVAGMRYAIRLLRENVVGAPRLVWMFVQGRLLRPNAPIEVRGGAAFLAQRSGAILLPLVIRYEWLGESRPSVFINVGAPLPSETPPDALAGRMNELLAETDRALDKSALDDYIPWFAPSFSMNKRWDYFVHRFLHRRGPFESQNNLPR